MDDTIATDSCESKQDLSGLVTVVREKYTRSWPAYPQPRSQDLAATTSLGRALSGTYSTDAHFGAFVSSLSRRLGTAAAQEGIRPLVTAAVFDVDCEADPVPGAWRAELLKRARALDTEHPGAFFYETRGGARIVYLLPKPFCLEFAASSRQWKQRYALALAYLERRFGIEADKACADWTRLYRLPFVRRDGQDERRLTFGDPFAIGRLAVRGTDADVDRARQIVPSAFAHWKEEIDLTPSGELGLFYYLLSARNWVIGDHPNKDVWIVRCPNEAAHSKGSAGDTSTVLFPPSKSKEYGRIHCKHGHCSEISYLQWTTFFSVDELLDAQELVAEGQEDG